MFKQGVILEVDLGKTEGHEQGGFRPVVVVSGDTYNSKSNGMAVVVPVSNTKNTFPMNVPIPKDNPVTGKILTQHINTLDFKARKFKVLGELDSATLNECLKIIDSVTK